MSFYLARLEAAREQHRMMMAAAAAAHAHAHAPRAWPPCPHQQHAGLLPLPQHHPFPPPPPPPPLHAGGSRAVDTWRGLRAGASLGVGDGARGGVAGSATGVTAAREEAGRGGGGEEVRNKRPLPPTTPRPRSPTPKRRAVAAAAPAAARRLFPPGCGRDPALPLAGADGDADADADASRSVAARGDGAGSGAPHKSALPPPPRPALAGGMVDSVLCVAASSPSAAAAASSTALNKAPASNDASRSVAVRGDGDGDGAGSGAPHKSALPPPRPALAGGMVDSVLCAAASSPSDAAAAGSSALKKASASNGAAGVRTDDAAHHCQGERLVKPSEALGRNGVAAAATAGALMDAADSQGVAGQGSGELSKSKDCVVPSMRLIPKPTTVSANRHFPPGCRRLGAPMPAGNGTTNQVVCLPSPEKEAQESQVSSSAVTLNHATASVVEAFASHTSSSGERIGNRWHGEEMSSSAVPAIDANVTNKSAGGSLCNVVAAESESLAQGLSKECDNSESVSECAALNTTCSDDIADAIAMSGEGAVMRKKIMHTPRKSVKPPRLIQKSVHNTEGRPFSKEIDRETEFVGWSVTMNDIEDTGVFTKDRAIEDPPMSVNKSSWTNEKEAAYFGPKKRVSKKKLKNKRRVAVKGRPTSACALDAKEDSILEDDEIFKVLAAHETRFEFGPQSADPRSKVKIICTRFESICRAIVQAAEHRSMKVRRIDLAPDKLIRKMPGFTKQGPFVGSVPGVEIGDEFLYRVQLALVGLHRPFQGGIDSTRHETGVRIAISVVASGGYPDELLSSSGELVYTGSGQKGNGDQKLEHGNLALKNCIGMKTPVRVIHGFRGQNVEEGSHSRAREISTFTYDGLYRVVDCWREGLPGSKVLKYKLQRIPGQPQLSLRMAKAPR